MVKNCQLLLVQPNVNLPSTARSFQGRIFISFTGGVEKILGGVQIICNIPFLMLWEGHEMANQSAPGGWSKILEGLNTF